MKGQTVLQMTGRGQDCSFLLFWPVCQHPNTHRKRCGGAVTLNSHAGSLIVVKDRHNALVYARIKFGSHSSAVGNDSPLDLWGKDWSSTEVTTRPTRAQRCVHPPGKEPMPSELASGVRLPMFSTKKKASPSTASSATLLLNPWKSWARNWDLVSKRFHLRSCSPLG